MNRAGPKAQFLIAAAALASLAGCAGGSYTTSARYYPTSYYDSAFRYGVWGHHHDVDVNVNLPDRPRPPVGGRPNRPVTLPAHVGGRPHAGSRVGRGGGARHRRR